MNPYTRRSFLLNLVFTAFGVFCAQIVPGVEARDVIPLLLAALILSLLNAVLKPLLILLALPFVLLTLGFGLVLINALLLWVTNLLVPGFEVSGFWSAVGGAIVISIAQIVLSAVTGERPRLMPHRRHRNGFHGDEAPSEAETQEPSRGRISADRNDVIDV